MTTSTFSLLQPCSLGLVLRESIFQKLYSIIYDNPDYVRMNHNDCILAPISQRSDLYPLPKSVAFVRKMVCSRSRIVHVYTQYKCTCTYILPSLLDPHMILSIYKCSLNYILYYCNIRCLCGIIVLIYNVVDNYDFNVMICVARVVRSGKY